MLLTHNYLNILSLFVPCNLQKKNIIDYDNGVWAGADMKAIVLYKKNLRFQMIIALKKPLHNVHMESRASQLNDIDLINCFSTRMIYKSIQISDTTIKSNLYSSKISSRHSC